MIEQFDEHVRKNYGVSEIMSVEKDGAYIYFNQGTPLVKFLLFPSQVIVVELFVKTGSDIVVWKQKEE